MPTLTFKVNETEASQIRAQARVARVSVSEFLRKSALGASTQGERSLRKQKHPVSGLTCDASVEIPVSEAEIRAALDEFP